MKSSPNGARRPARPRSLLRVAALAFALCGNASFLLPCPLAAQDAPTVSQVLANVQRVFDKIEDYTADIKAIVDMPGVKLSPMNAKVYFKKPAKVHVEAAGFAMLPRDVVSFNPRMLGEDRYDAVIQGEERVDGIPCMKVKLLARSDTLRLQRIVLLIDPERWLILTMRTDPAQGRSAEARFTYAFVDNRYFVPSRIAVSMDVPAMNVRPGKPSASEGPKRGTVTLQYTNYRINKGIDDAVFRSKEKP